MRVLYASRQARLLRAARRHLTGLVDVRPAEAGMHLVAELPPDADDVAIAARAIEAGVVVRPISTQYLGRPSRRALLLGYAGVPEREIDRGIELLARVLQDGSRRSSTRGLRSKP
jgi:GntR family transcriptional regulator/MocR family aminotransferase